MVSDTLEQRIYELVRSHDGIYLFKKKELTPSTDLDSDLRLEDDEALALMDDFFTTFNVDRGNFSITTYYPPEPPLKHLLKVTLATDGYQRGHDYGCSCQVVRVGDNVSAAGCNGVA